MFCTRCGTQLDAAARFCVACGRATSAAPEPATAPEAEYASAPEQKKLRRIMQGKKIAGVCNGYAEYFSMDITLMRLIWIGLLLVPPHIGLIGYIVSWAVLPKVAVPKGGSDDFLRE
jgi:phage shock protein C